ncbi:TPD1 protein homolog 1-like [Cucurbita moschata]|uniref:TPD1 protein homolog 1-like n=1 Tax=Cucurbita moschata TaxID=3662 RepID=A0A6J1H526_CUCMO|nr:TPD1 protein homolog 1-like [Cucurbita moschata]
MASSFNHTNPSIPVEPERALLHRKKPLKQEKCSGRDISISQGQVSTSGIPQYAVEIMNTCLSDCAPLDVHLSCGMFSSANLINPRLFRRLGNDDCLVNGGRALKPGQIIRFVYSTTFKFPLAFKSAKFC